MTTPSYPRTLRVRLPLPLAQLLVGLAETIDDLEAWQATDVREARAIIEAAITAHRRNGARPMTQNADSVAPTPEMVAQWFHEDYERLAPVLRSLRTALAEHGMALERQDGDEGDFG